MTAEHLLGKVCKLFPLCDVKVGTDIWHMRHISGDGLNATHCTLFIMPGIDGEETTLFTGGSIQECGEKLMAKVQEMFERDDTVPTDLRDCDEPELELSTEGVQPHGEQPYHLDAR